MAISRRNSSSSCTLKKSGSSLDDGRAREQYLMNKSKEYLQPGPVFRTVTRLYAERKLYLFLTIHYIVTLIVWGKLVASLYSVNSRCRVLGPVD